MPRRPIVKPHLTPDELESRFRASRDPVERLRYQVIFLMSSGSSTRKVAETTGYSIPWVRRLVHEYNENGPGCLTDRRHANPGATPMLSPAQQAELAAALHQAPPGGGKWTSQKVADWIGARTGRTTYPQRGWVYLRKLGPVGDTAPTPPTAD
ncbi:MAG: helix-turn-helix domain-containing protein [Armatimonadetes bacterium]|nr:helix-turn-helix domain-containing protein [Armatimonadota bacterium]